MKIAVAIPFISDVNLRWALSLRLLQIQVPHIFIITSSYEIDQAREELAKDALESGCTHILYMDSDIRPNSDAVIRALNHRYPFVSGSYWLKKGHWCGLMDTGNGYTPLPVPTNALSITADYVGLGFALIDMRIFKQLKPPWFVYQRESDDELPPYFTKGIIHSEDAWFCRRCREELGIRPLIDPTIILKHSDTMELNYNGKVEFQKVVTNETKNDAGRQKVEGTV